MFCDNWKCSVLLWRVTCLLCLVWVTKTPNVLSSNIDPALAEDAILLTLSPSMCSAPFNSVLKSFFLAACVCVCVCMADFPFVGRLILKVWDGNDSHISSLFTLGAVFCVCSLPFLVPRLN